MADELGAVRRTARPTGDRQTPETGPQESAGTTNTASPASGGQPAVSSRVSSQGSEEGWKGVETALAELRGKLHATAVLGHLHTTDNDMQAFLELPDCQACEGTGKDDHGTVFEAPLAVHFAGPPVEIVGRRRQLCMWCGHVLSDVMLAVGEYLAPWPTSWLIVVEDGIVARLPYEPGDPLPPGCCALPDDDSCPTCDKHRNGCDFCCGTNTGDGSREELTSGDTLPDSDDAQETRADWPAETEDGDRG